MEHAETSISGRTEPDYKQLTVQAQIKKFLMHSPNICLLG